MFAPMHGGRSRIGKALAIAACGLASVVGAHAGPHFFPIASSSLFADVRAQLRSLVDEVGTHGENRFCVIGEDIAGERQAYVYWPGENRLILWEPQRGNPRAIAGSRRNLDLRSDVVDGDDVGGSTYKLTRATADAIVRACRARGNWYQIGRSGRPGD